MAQHHSTPTIGRVAIIGLLAWLVPGLGHIANGERKRGLIILVTIACSFWGGIAIGGVRYGSSIGVSTKYSAICSCGTDKI